MRYLWYRIENINPLLEYLPSSSKNEKDTEMSKMAYEKTFPPFLPSFIPPFIEDLCNQQRPNSNYNSLQ